MRPTIILTTTLITMLNTQTILRLRLLTYRLHRWSALLLRTARKLQVVLV
jgi:hypothetical protein